MPDTDTKWTLDDLRGDQRPEQPQSHRERWDFHAWAAGRLGQDPARPGSIDAGAGNRERSTAPAAGYASLDAWVRRGR
jgi:hypothetical protein